MIMVLKLNPDTYQEIMDLVGKGAYLSVESFVEVAIMNQIQLEKEGIPELAGKRAPSTQEMAGPEPTPKPGNKLPIETLELFNLPENTSLPVLQAQPLTERAKNLPLWGQINRLGPAKFVLRLLEKQVALSGSDRVDLKRFSAEVAESATLIRTYIEKKDKTQRIRGEGLHVAFPKKDPRSQQRFINFYVGKFSGGKSTDGVLTGLSLARIGQTEDGSTTIGLTEAGLQLACMHSPLIDDFILAQIQVQSPFSAQEVEFMLKHTKSFRPGDYDFLISILRFVQEGDNTPTSLHPRVSKFLKDTNFAGTISEKVVNTMQVGAIGRLVEMRLLGIKKNAQKSTYKLTNKGKTVLSNEVKS
jgi:hypothetical protein